MRKCISLEDQPGFQDIYSPVLQQAIDRGLKGHSGTGQIDWGYKPFKKRTGTKPLVRPIKGKPIKIVSGHYKVENSVYLGQGEYWDYILNAYATPYFRSIVNKYPAPKIKVYNKGGYFSAYNSKHGIIYTPKGSTTDISTLLHEYGHYLDNILGFEIQGTTDGIKLATSKLFVDEMIADGTSLGLVIDSSAYWQYLFDNGIDTSFKGTTKFKVLKGRSQQEISRKMKPGDFWRVMEEIQTLAKGDVTKIKNTKNPDPVKLKRAEETYANLTGLYDKYLEGIESAKQLLDNAMSLKLGENKTEEEGGIVEHLGALMDIIEALTSGDFTDYQIATGDHFSPRGHGGGYYSTRLYRDDKKWKVRNHNQEMADNFKRYEIFAQLSQFMSHKDDTAIQFMRLTMPNLVEKFEFIMSKADEGSLAFLESSMKDESLNPE